MTHLKIILAGLGPDKHAKPVDISSLVRSHELISTVGSARMLRLELFAVGEINDDTITGIAKEPV